MALNIVNYQSLKIHQTLYDTRIIGGSGRWVLEKDEEDSAI